ncbi:MAG: ATP-dependent helicase HrpB [Pseudomonadota bacterium]
MANPVGALGQASQKIVEEIQKQAQQQVQNQQTQQVNKFQDVMATQQAGQVNQASQVSQLQHVSEVNKVESPNKAVETLKAAKLNASDTTHAVEPGKETMGKGFKNLLGGMVEGQGKLDSIIKLATSGKKFDPQQLLAIQASVYKYSQELELTSKVVEKATSGVKQTMQTQV